MLTRSKGGPNLVSKGGPRNQAQTCCFASPRPLRTTRRWEWLGSPAARKAAATLAPDRQRACRLPLLDHEAFPTVCRLPAATHRGAATSRLFFVLDNCHLRDVSSNDGDEVSSSRFRLELRYPFHRRYRWPAVREIRTKSESPPPTPPPSSRRMRSTPDARAILTPIVRLTIKIRCHS